MSLPKKGRAALIAGLPAGGLALSACSAGSLGSSTTAASPGAAADVTITLLADNSDQTTKTAQAAIDAFNATKQGVTVKLDTRTQGTDGDNIVKTKLATGDMADVSSTTPVRCCRRSTRPRTSSRSPARRSWPMCRTRSSRR